MSNRPDAADNAKRKESGREAGGSSRDGATQRDVATAPRVVKFAVTSFWHNTIPYKVCQLLYLIDLLMFSISLQLCWTRQDRIYFFEDFYVHTNLSYPLCRWWRPEAGGKHQTMTGISCMRMWAGFTRILHTEMCVPNMSSRLDLSLIF